MGGATDVVQPPVRRAARDKRGVPLAREHRGWRDVPRVCRSGRGGIVQRAPELVRLPTLVVAMKTAIHPEYAEATVRCTCGNEFITRSTKGDMHVEICSNCHPFYTGKQKLVDTGGRVERFQRKLARSRSK